ncbi:stress responsive alpha/beta barrel protein [Thiobaca trueperi]|uniref:Stress responsive alpha/beta barrel protein n=2 Tax=Thiobaca trueperi TaxID=127458 RepID=A0A4R3N271_9GAMM|nr:stress responsive alpha/beta barrel protein [Thiobaca trueperi]
MMAEGQRVLAGIPGVREVQAGSVIDQSAHYRYCWLIRFSAPEALDSYRHHPAHLAFVERPFRPMATDRMSADYQVADARTGVAALPDAASLAQTDGLAA